MTLVAAWIRTVGSVEELLVASDSRLRGEGAWDCCPKIMTLPRSDAVICFAGDTALAYPLMLQMRAAIDIYTRSRTRAMDLYDMKGHTLRVFNGMLTHLVDLPKGLKTPSAPRVEFVLAGFSWRKRHFAIWRLYYDKHISGFTFLRVGNWKGIKEPRKAALFGDSLPEARGVLKRILKERKKLTTGPLDMEPFEVIRDMSRDVNHPNVGGAPQVAKVYRHMNSQVFGVFWPERSSRRVTVLGRPLLDYEETDFGVLDPDNPTANPVRYP
jgi:hypothetical protein